MLKATTCVYSINFTCSEISFCAFLLIENKTPDNSAQPCSIFMAIIPSLRFDDVFEPMELFRFSFILFPMKTSPRFFDCFLEVNALVNWFDLFSQPNQYRTSCQESHNGFIKISDGVITVKFFRNHLCNELS